MSTTADSPKAAVSESSPATDLVDQDAVSALTNLGYAASDAYRAVLAAKGKANDNEHDNLQVLEYAWLYRSLAHEQFSRRKKS